jgi:hypothetical protein
MISNDVRWLRDRSCGSLSATSFDRHARIPRERTISPVHAPSTGAVRPQIGLAAVADMTPHVAQGKAVSRVRTWSPPV